MLDTRQSNYQKNIPEDLDISLKQNIKENPLETIT